jgi:NTE family protein
MTNRQLYILMFLLMVIVLVVNRKPVVYVETNTSEHIQDQLTGSENYYWDNSWNFANKRTYKNAKNDLGLVLSGGGMKGFCHVGALKAMDEKGIKPDIISGVSAGALVGALYADGYSPDSMVKMFDQLKLIEYMRLDFSNGGLLKMEGLKHLLDTILRAKTFEELKIPLRIVATDLDNGQSVVFESGNLADAVLASCTVPILFSPYVINGINYVDGGVFRNLPASAIRNDCKLIIGVNVGPMDKGAYQKSMMDIAKRSYKFIYRSNSNREKQLCDILIEPQEILLYNGASIRDKDQMFTIGYNETTSILDNKEVKRLIRFK